MAEETSENQEPEASEPPASEQPVSEQPASPQTSSTAASGSGKSSTGLDTKIAGLLCYFFGWVSGLIFFLIEKEDQVVRFHAVQSIALSLVAVVLSLVIGVVTGALGFMGLGFALAFMGLMPLLTLAVWIYSLTIGYSGEIKKLPVIGDIAEQYYQTQP